MDGAFFWLEPTVEACRAHAHAANVRFDWKPEPPATADDLMWLEESLAAAIPESLRAFLLMCNGAELLIGCRSGDDWWGQTLFFLGARGIVAFALDKSGDEERGAFLAIADLEDGNEAGMRRSPAHEAIEATIYDLDHDVPPEFWPAQPVGRDIENWLRSILVAFADGRRSVGFEQDEPLVMP